MQKFILGVAQNSKNTTKNTFLITKNVNKRKIIKMPE
jgi:hypothetical protein